MTPMAPETPLPTSCDVVTHSVTLAPPRSAARMRQHRARKARDACRVSLDVEQQWIESLEANGYLEGGRDHDAIADAVRLFMFDHMPQ